MKKIMLTLLAAGLFVSAFAQSEYKKRPTLAVQFFLNDFQTAADIKAGGLANVLRTKNWHDTKRMTPGIAVSYMHGLGEHLDFSGTLSGSYIDYPMSNGAPSFGNNFLLLEAAATVNVKLMTDKYCFVPYLTIGAGASKYKGYYGAFIPVGVGVQQRLWEDAYLLVGSQYRIAATENANYHFYHSIGIASTLCKKKVVPAVVVLPPPPAPEPPKDRDGDGVIDSLDRCPDVKGLASLNGCPDSDGDGIVDKDDKCPNAAGLAKYQGCPVPDTDKDGINDENDKCVDVPGVARYQGCPVPDTDKDGVNDEEDKCPNEAGPADNFGCPVIEKAVIDKINVAAKNIFFVTGSAKLMAKSNKALDEVAKIMTANPSYKIEIDGHTDNTGKADKNQALSENRAKAVADYLKSKGVSESRLNAMGFGQDKPIADNKTAAGRAKNRRVELKVSNY